jgi:prevent-host-death family protein
MRVGLREANQNSWRVISAVSGGTEVVLTDRGRPIAKLTPINARSATHKESVEETLRRLEAAGLVRRATNSGPMPRFEPIKISGASLSKTIQDERDER